MNFINMMIILGILSMLWWRQNIISMLLSLELILITLYFSISLSIPTISLSSLLIMLIMMASGSSMGLSLLISMSHSHNSSNSIYMNSLLTFDKNYTPIYYIITNIITNSNY